MKKKIASSLVVFFTCDIFGLIFLFYIFRHDFFLSDFLKKVILDFV